MKLRHIYIILSTFLGVVFAYYLAAFLIALFGGLFGMVIFKDRIWPIWTGSLLITVGIATFLGTMTVFILYGYRYGLKLEKHTDHATYYYKSIIYLIVAMLILIVVGGYAAYRMRISNVTLGLSKEQKIISQLTQSLKPLEDIEINQLEKGIEIVTSINGPVEDKYSLTFNLVAQKFVQESVLFQTQPVELKLKQQSFHFEIPFDELAKQYRKIIEEYALNFYQRFDVDEIFEVQLKLQLIETPAYNAQQIETFKIPPQENSTLLRLSFNCYLDKCEVVQKNEASNPSEEPASADNHSKN